MNTNEDTLFKARREYSLHYQGVNPKLPDRTRRPSKFFFNAEILPLLTNQHSGIALDVGCGYGYTIRHLIDSGCRRVWGVDIDRRLIHIANGYIGDQAELLVCTDAMRFLAAYRNTFTLITLVDVIEHFSHDDALELLSAIREALMPQGRAIFRTPNMANILGTYSRYMDLTHQTGYTEQSFSHLLRLAGFSEVTVHVPQYDLRNPRGRKLKIMSMLHQKLFEYLGRTQPKSYEKNIIVWASK
jgi:2-polyprenyl-3-methyl-5-hydroxy-6-metoxy-1,4-benzoquinol methylase